MRRPGEGRASEAGPFRSSTQQDKHTTHAHSLFKMPTRHPNVLWAQRRDHVYLTIDLQGREREERERRGDGALRLVSVCGSGSAGVLMGGGRRGAALSSRSCLVRAAGCQAHLSLWTCPVADGWLVPPGF